MKRPVFALACLVVTALVLVIFVRKPGINGYKPAMFGDMIHGDANRPFVNRALLPMATRAIVAVLPESLRSSLGDEALARPGIHKLLKDLKWEHDLLPEYLVATALMGLSLLGFLLVVRCLFRTVAEGPGWLFDLTALLAVLGLPAFFKYYSYIYDFPALFLFTLGLALLARERWGLFLAVYLVSCFNKETTILLSVIFVIRFLLRGRPGRADALKLGAAQLAIFLFSRGALHAMYGSNPGGTVEFHLLHNLQLLKPYPLATFVAWLAVVVLVARDWKGKPEFLRDAAWIVLPLFALTITFGLYDELRDYYEAYPIVFLLMMWSVADVLGVKLKALR
ncbi:MAG: hypothetical protein V1929_11240 [bacterium]